MLIAIISVRTLKAPKIADLDSWPSNTQDNDTHNYNSIIIILFSYHDKPLNYVIDKEADQLFLLPRRRPLLWGRCWSSWRSSEANWDFLSEFSNFFVETWSMGISRPGNFSSVYLSLTAASSFGVIAAMNKVLNISKQFCWVCSFKPQSIDSYILDPKIYYIILGSCELTSCVDVIFPQPWVELFLKNPGEKRIYMRDLKHSPSKSGFCDQHCHLSRVSVDIPWPQMVMAGYSRDAIGRAVVCRILIVILQCPLLSSFFKLIKIMQDLFALLHCWQWN